MRPRHVRRWLIYHEAVGTSGVRAPLRALPLAAAERQM